MNCGSEIVFSQLLYIRKKPNFSCILFRNFPLNILQNKTELLILRVKEIEINKGFKIGIGLICSRNC